MAQSVLMIDAEQPFSENVAEVLRGKGLEVEVVGDGKAGLERARKVDPKPDLIILCVELPKMSGYSICNKLKKDDELKQIPLIITSSEATPETFEQHRKLKTRADGYLIKPYETDRLVEELEGLIPLDGAGEDVMELDESDLDLEPEPDETFDLSNLAEEVDRETDALLALEPEEGELSVDTDALDDDGFDLELEDEPLSLSDAEVDSDLANFDEAFENLSQDDDGDGVGADLEEPDLDALLQPDPDLELEEEPDLELEEEPDLELEEEPDLEIEDEPDLALEEEPAMQLEDEPTPRRSERAARAKPGASAETEKQLRDVRRKNSEMQARVAELETRLRAAEQQAKQKTEDLDSIQSTSSTSQRELLDLKQQLHEKEKELFKLKEESFSKEKAAFEAEDKLAEMQKKLDDATASQTDQEAKIATLNTQVSSLTEERNTIEQESQDRIASLEGQLTEVEDERDQQVSALEGERDSLKRKLEASERTAQERADRVETLSSELASKEEQIAEMYRKSKTDEGMRERALKAVEIANALLSGQLSAEEEEASMEI